MLSALFARYSVADNAVILQRNAKNRLKNLLTATFLGITRRFMLEKELKEKIIEKFKTHPTDTGSPQVQIAILTEEIKQLISHLQKHKKDFSSRRGLLRKVSERRRLLKYLAREDKKAYEKLLEQLRLRK